MPHFGTVRIEVSIEREPAVANNLHAVHRHAVLASVFEHLDERRGIQSDFFRRRSRPVGGRCCGIASLRVRTHAERKGEHGHGSDAGLHAHYPNPAAKALGDYSLPKESAESKPVYSWPVHRGEFDWATTHRALLVFTVRAFLV